ncbi:MAG: hypothetical protein J1F32_06965 [Erysipelotrichales bacterium]|nr:hypothetical protein [Erysipelotrichales bacterium]
MKFFLIGIKGSGMAALAGILKDDGHEVSGVDIDHKVFTEGELLKRDISYQEFNDEFEYPNDVDYFIIGHNFMKDEVILKIKEKNKPYKEYHEFIAMYFKNLYQVAITGTHGKTTTTGYFYYGLKKYVNTSMLRGDGTGIGGFQNNFFVYEACEYKDHYLVYHPNTIIITNIDYDHVDYFKTKKQYNSSFNKFAKNAKTVFINYEDRNKIHHKNLITFGENIKADYYYKNLELSNGIKGEIYYKDKLIKQVEVPIFGKYNALHILAVIAFLHHNNFDLTNALDEFNKIPCIKRRLQQKIIARDVFIDDYAHHPNEIQASLDNVRLMYPRHRVVAIFKPDRYSRLVEFQKEFKRVLLNFEKAYILPLYESTSENSILLKANTRISYIDTLDQLITEEKLMENTVYLFMSSKNIDSWLYGLATSKELTY